jgi:hypothetical protein
MFDPFFGRVTPEEVGEKLILRAAPEKEAAGEAAAASPSRTVPALRIASEAGFRKAALIDRADQTTS